MEDFGVVAGEYDLIGKAPGAGKLFSATATFVVRSKPDALTVKWRGPDGVSTGTVVLSLCGPDDMDLLEFSFESRGEKFDAGCLRRGDMDNYQLITCRVRSKLRPETGEGLLAFFPRHRGGA